MENIADLRRLSLLSADIEHTVGGVEHLKLNTDGGSLAARFHPGIPGDSAVLWLSGAGGGLEGPARGMYPRLARQLTGSGISSLRLDYRRPGNLISCVLDALVGLEYLAARKPSRCVVAGHSFGGAVAITAGAADRQTAAVAALSSQTYGTDSVDSLSPRPVLVLHGSADTVLPESCARSIYGRARQPKSLLLYAGCGHGLDECIEEVDRNLTAWITDVLLAGESPRT